MNKNRLLTGIIIVLLLINSVVLFFMWRNHSEKRRSAIASPAEYLIQKTGMDSIQKEKYYVLVQQHRKATRRLKEELKEARETYFGYIGKEIADSTKQQSLNEVNNINSQLSTITFDHLTAVRTLCTKEQQAKFDDAIFEVLNMMSGPPKPPGGTGRGERPPHDAPREGRPPYDGPREMEDAP